MTKRDIETELEELADAITEDVDALAATTKAEAGVTAGFIRGANEEPQELAEGWTWERRESDREHGAAFMVAVREDDEGGGDDVKGPVEENGAKFIAFTENTEEDTE